MVICCPCFPWVATVPWAFPSLNVPKGYSLGCAPHCASLSSGTLLKKGGCLRSWASSLLKVTDFSRPARKLQAVAIYCICRILKLVPYFHVRTDPYPWHSCKGVVEVGKLAKYNQFVNPLFIIQKGHVELLLSLNPKLISTGKGAYPYQEDRQWLCLYRIILQCIQYYILWLSERRRSSWTQRMDITHQWPFLCMV